MECNCILMFLQLQLVFDVRKQMLETLRVDFEELGRN